MRQKFQSKLANLEEQSEIGKRYKTRILEENYSAAIYEQSEKQGHRQYKAKNFTQQSPYFLAAAPDIFEISSSCDLNKVRATSMPGYSISMNETALKEKIMCQKLAWACPAGKCHRRVS